MPETVKSFDWGQRPLVVGEVAQAHDGSLGMAHAFIDAIAHSGADAVKFQTHIASAESRQEEPWRVRFSYVNESRFEYWRRMEFEPEEWVGLREHATEQGLAFLSSPFSVQAAELLARVGISAWKVASGELTNTPLLDWIAETPEPILLSTGMSGWPEVDQAVARVSRRHAAQLAVLQCTSEYPAPPENVGLNVLGEIRDRYGCAPGISDHSGTVFPSIAAAALGARVIEVHVTLSPDMFGPDVPASVTPEELRLLCDGVRYIAAATAAPVEKDRMANRLSSTRQMFTKSIVASRDLEAGTVLSVDDLAVKKPAGGMPPERLESVLGRELRVPLDADVSLLEEHLVPSGGEG